MNTLKHPNYNNLALIEHNRVWQQGQQALSLWQQFFRVQSLPNNKNKLQQLQTIRQQAQQLVS